MLSTQFLKDGRYITTFGSASDRASIFHFHQPVDSDPAHGDMSANSAVLVPVRHRRGGGPSTAGSMRMQLPPARSEFANTRNGMLADTENWVRARYGAAWPAAISGSDPVSSQPGQLR